jgi:heme exporter protein B
MIAFFALLRRDLRLALRHGGDTLGAVLFFFVAVALFPLAIGPSPQLLSTLTPGLLWVCALLAALLPLDRLLGAELDDGSLDHLLLCGLPGSAVALGKAITHWLVTGLPLLCAAVPLAAMLHLPVAKFPILLGGLLMGTAVLSLLGTACAAIVLGARRGSVLLPILVLPLATPVLIFGAGALVDAPRANMLLLGAYLAACLPLCPVAAGAALRGAVE